MTSAWDPTTGVDSSREMIEAGSAGADVQLVLGDLRSWRPSAPVDVLVSNAALQWVPGHLELLPDLVGTVAPGGWFAFQAPGNFDAPSHVLRRTLAQDERFAGHVQGAAEPHAFGPEVYLESLGALGCAVDAWETTYLHVLRGDDPVFGWIVGTGARPMLNALPPGPRREFEDELRTALRAAYPAAQHGTVLPFRRVFVVAQVPESGIA
jgi:trans-aconitate 2-methyltransferase